MPAPSTQPSRSGKPWSDALPDLEGLLERLIRHRVEFVVIGDFALIRETAAELHNPYLETNLGQLDCLGDVLGVGGYERVLAESVSVPLPAGPCRILSIDALIRAKEAMGRERDRQAVLQLRAIRERNPGG